MDVRGIEDHSTGGLGRTGLDAESSQGRELSSTASALMLLRLRIARRSKLSRSNTQATFEGRPAPRTVWHTTPSAAITISSNTSAADSRCCECRNRLCTSRTVRHPSSVNVVRGEAASSPRSALETLCRSARIRSADTLNTPGSTRPSARASVSRIVFTCNSVTRFAALAGVRRHLQTPRRREQTVDFLSPLARHQPMASQTTDGSRTASRRERRQEHCRLRARHLLPILDRTSAARSAGSLPTHVLRTTPLALTATIVGVILSSLSASSD
jgi:hypothetical protein